MSSPGCQQSQLIAAGSQPARFGFIVKLIRRFLWPFIRPFHFFHLNKINDINLHLNKINETGLGSDGFRNLVKDHLLLRTELAALKHRIPNLLPLSNLLITVTKHGIFIAKPGEIISDFIIEGGIWDDHIVKLAHEVALTRRGEAIDIGAHLGSITMALSSFFDRVFSFEPNDFNFRILRANVALNNLENVCLYNNALYSHSTNLSLAEEEKQEVALVLSDGDFNGMVAKNLGAYVFTENDSGIFNHSARTLDSYELDNITFIKIDVQGADGEVLMGALQTIRRCQPVIVFEWEEKLSKNFNVTLDTVKNELHHLGYEIKVLKAHHEKQIDYMALPITFRAKS